MHVFEGETADEVWRKAATIFHEEANIPIQESREGKTKELLHAAFVIQNPRERWSISRHPALNPVFALAEVIWILSGRNDAAFLNRWNSRLPDYAGNVSVYHGAYGYRLRNHFGVDQIEQAYNALRNNPDGRQILLQIWDAAVDLPSDSGRPQAHDIPCNICSMLKVRNGKLEWSQVLRSNDLFRGTPYNFVQFTYLQEIIAGWLNLDVGTYVHISDSLHVYEKDAASLNGFEAITLETNIDHLRFTKTEFDAELVNLCSQVEALAEESLTIDRLRKMTMSVELSQALQNIFALFAAEEARRRNWIALTPQLIATCRNPALIQVWNRWSTRFSKL